MIRAPLSLVILLALFVSGCGKQEITSLKADLTTAQRELAATKQDLVQANTRLQQADLDRGHLEAQLAEQNTRVQQAADRESRLNQELLTVKTERDELTVKAASLTAKLNVLDAEQEKAAKAAAEAARHSELTVQLGVTMKSGESKPVTNARVYLMRTALLQLLPGDYGPKHPGVNAAGAWALGLGQYSLVLGKYVPEIVSAVQAAAVTTATTDFSGRASFPDVEHGDYYVLCATALGGGVTLEKRVTVSGKPTFVGLDNDDALRAISDAEGR